MREIRHSRGKWSYDEQGKIGEGGFGAVFHGSDSAGNQIAIKRLDLLSPKSTKRELRIAEDLVGQSDLQNVLPVLDAGKEADSDECFIVMPLAEGSLQDAIDKNRSFSEPDAVAILSQIAAGMYEVRHLAHRDLKPPNVLLHEGRWKVADWGIAKFVAESTSVNTLRGCLTPAYAAPEQWLRQAGDNATDIYALACIAYALLTGEPPFSGKDEDELQQKHLQKRPSACPACSLGLQGFLLSMLQKAKEARPSLDRTVQYFRRLAASPATGSLNRAMKALESAGAEVSERRSAQDAARAVVEAEARRRADLFRAGEETLRGCVKRLFDAISVATPAATVAYGGSEARAQMGNATLEIDLKLVAVEPGAFTHSKWDVIAGTSIVVHCEDASTTQARGASLFYVKRPGDVGYRWLEVAIEANPLAGSLRPPWRHSIPLLDPRQADLAVSPVMASFQTADHPRFIDCEDVEDFCERWGELLATACRKML